MDTVNKYILAIDVGIKNLSYCLLEQVNTTKRINILRWENVCVSSTNTKDYKLEQLCEDVLLVLQQNFNDNFNADVVLIENQPGLMNGKMKTVSVMIYTFFVMLKLQFGNVDHVQFTSASSKFKCGKLQNDALLCKSVDTYKDRKQLSIALTRLYVEEIDPYMSKWFEAQNKKDDLADAFLFCVSYLEQCNNA